MREVWKMTPFQISALYRIHLEITQGKRQEASYQDPIDAALGGL